LGKSAAQIERFLQTDLVKFDGPAQFLGDEPNARRKPWDSATVRMLLAASWPYAASAGNQAIPMVYSLINDGDPSFLCDRSYLPLTPADFQRLRKNHIPVFGIESKHQALDFDVVGTSISYAVLIMSFAAQLTSSGIPARRTERERSPEDYPMVMVGGLQFGAPESLAAVVDCVFIGEVEDEPDNPGLLAVLNRIKMFKENRLWNTVRTECYKSLAQEFRFLYFPSFIDVHYEYLEDPELKHPSKQVVGYSSNLEGLILPLKRRYVKDMNNLPGLTKPPLLYTDVENVASDWEVARGCPAWCSFCALSYRQKPPRQKDVGLLVEGAKELHLNTGGKNVTPFAPDLPMYSETRALTKGLLESVSAKVDAGAVRIDDFVADEELLTVQIQGGMDTVTLGVEGTSQRMRDLVGKGASDQDVLEVVARAIQGGIKKIKLFMISSLPGEELGDIWRAVELAKEIAAIREGLGRRTRIQFSWTPFLIEAGTPMQWFEVLEHPRLLKSVFDEFKNIDIMFKIGTKSSVAKIMFFQLCQRASREAGEAILDVLLLLDRPSWGGVSNTIKDHLEEALKEHGFHNGFDDFFGERSEHDMFGWEFIDLGISRKLLWSTYQQMREFLQLTDPETYGSEFDASYHGNEWVSRCDVSCNGSSCGVCDKKDLQIRSKNIRAAKKDRLVPIESVQTKQENHAVVKVWVRVTKNESHRFVTNEHWYYAVRRAFNLASAACSFPYYMSRNSLNFVSDVRSYRDWSVGTDYLEFGLTGTPSREAMQSLFESMNTFLGQGLQLDDLVFVPTQTKRMRLMSPVFYWSLEVPGDLRGVRSKIDDFKSAQYVKLTLNHEGEYFRSREPDIVNAKDYVEDVWLVRDGHRTFIKLVTSGRPSPYDICNVILQVSRRTLNEFSAECLDVFVSRDHAQRDFFHPSCESCGKLIPVNLINVPYSRTHCPQCADVTHSIDGSLV
jgi:radical SAM superfamily enzyme YgiQ (UPF0313 family)